MLFAISTRYIDGFEQVMLTDIYAGTQVSIIPAAGAAFHAFIIQTAAGPWNVIDNYANAETLEMELMQSYKGCKLSPFACRILSGQYQVGEERHQLSTLHSDGSAIHGLLYKKNFLVVDTFCDDSLATVHLKYNYREDDAGFPYNYRCDIYYTLFAGNILEIATTVLNLGDQAMPVADGWHPYFRLGGTVDGWLLRFDSTTRLDFNEGLVPTGQLLYDTAFEEERTIGKTVIDSCFLLNKEASFAPCTLFNPANGIGIGIFPDESYQYLQVYTPPQRQSIAIENLSGAPDCFNNRMGLTMLPARNSKTFTVRYQISIE